MRTDTPTFHSANVAPQKSPRFVVAIIYPVGSLYITSHAGIASVPGTVLDGCLQQPSAISQRIIPDEGRSEIGSMSFDLVDIDSQFTDAVRDLLDNGEGLRGKQARLYVGYEGMAFTAFQLFQTQVVSGVEYDEGVYRVQCRDITREQRKEIFEPKKTTLRDSVSAADTTIPVYVTSDFRTVAHGPSYADAPSAVVGYIKIEDEVIRYTGKTADTFTGCTRAVLNTRAVEHAVDAATTADRRAKVEEYIYLELPAAKLARAVQTGEISPNYCPNGGFETDTNVDGTSDGWVVFVGSSGDAGRTHSLTRPASQAGMGVCQRVEITGGVGNANDTGLDLTTAGGLTRIACGAGTCLPEGTTYFLSAWVRTNATSKVTIRVRNLPGTLDDVSTTHPGGSAWVLMSKAGTVRASQTTLDVQIRGITLAGEWFEVDEIMLEVATARSGYAEGPIAGRSNELPSHWHCGIDPLLVRTSDFVGIGSDLWDTRLDTNGFIGRFTQLTKVDGKKFLESELYVQLGCYSPVYSDGTVGLKRMNHVLSDAPFVVELNENNCVEWSGLRHELDLLHNHLRVDWNWDGEEFTRRNDFIDADSVAIHGSAPIKELRFKGLHGARHTDAIVRTRLDALRDRYSYPPETMSITVLPSLNRLEVGDIVRANLPTVRDFAGAGANINRSVEIQQMRMDFATGNVVCDVFGSTGRASVDSPTADTSPLPDAYYTAQGVNINTVATVNVVGNVGVIQPGTYNLTGNADMNASGAVYYYDGDLELADGAILTINDNVQIRVMGFFTINGDIDGVGRGKAGVADSGGYGAVQAGTPGFIGNSRGMDGVSRFFLRQHGTDYGTVPCSFTQGANAAFPFLELKVSGNTLLGIPSDQRGTSGGGGGKLVDENDDQVESLGGTGADSGAGLAIICRGLSIGASGSVNTSGDSSAATSATTIDSGTFRVYPGAGGAGSPGGFLILLDGEGISIPDIGGKFIASTGTVPVSGTTMPLRFGTFERMVEGGWTEPGSGYRDESLITAQNMANSAHRIQYVPESQTPAEDGDRRPTKPAVLFVEAAVESVRLRIGGVDIDSVDVVQFYSSPTNDRTVATLAAEGKFGDTVFPILDQQVRFYWARTGLRTPGGRLVFSDWEPAGATNGATNAPLRGNSFCPDAEFARATDDTYWIRSNASKMTISATGGTYGGYLRMDFSAPEEGGARILQPRADLLPILSGQSVSVRVRVRLNSTITGATVWRRLTFDVFTFDDPNESFSAGFTSEGVHTIIENLNALTLGVWQEFAMTVPTSALTRTYARVRLASSLNGPASLGGELDIDYFQAQLDTPIFAANSAGLVPIPTATTTGQQKLKDDGTWGHDHPVTTAETAATEVPADSGFAFQSRPLYDFRRQGAGPAESLPTNAAALAAAVAVADEPGAGVGAAIVVGPDTPYGRVTSDVTTHPDFAGVTAPTVVIDYSQGDSYAGYPTGYDGAQVSYFFHTPETTGTATFTGSLSGGATSATLSATWPRATGPWSVTFSNGDQRAVTFTSGATTATWSGGLSSGATATASFVNNGQHDGNGVWIRGTWNPYLVLSNDANYAAASHATRRALDNRRCGLSLAVDGIVSWIVGQGVNIGHDKTNEQMADFYIQKNPIAGDTLGALGSMLIQRSTGNWSIGNATTAPQAALHVISPSLSFYQAMFESAATDTSCFVVLRNANGIADDCIVKNVVGALVLHIASQGDAVTIAKATRRVAIEQALQQKRVVVTYSASMTINAAAGNFFSITATNGTAFTINAPSSPAEGQRISVIIRNTSGGALGAATWNAVFKLAAWTNPGNGNNRSIDFVYDQTNWVEVSRTPADVPN